MAAPESRNERRKARAIEALLSAAAQAFAERSYDDVGVEEIADAADVAVGTLYNHFGSKEALYLAVVERALDFDERYLDSAYDERKSVEEQLEAAGLAYLRFAVEQPTQFRMVAFPPQAGSGPAAERALVRIAERVAHQNARVAALIRLGIERGEIRPIDVDRATTFLWAAWNGVVALRSRSDSLQVTGEEFQALVEVGRDILRQGLVSGSAPSAPRTAAPKR